METACNVLEEVYLTDGAKNKIDIEGTKNHEGITKKLCLKLSLIIYVAFFIDLLIAYFRKWL